MKKALLLVLGMSLITTQAGAWGDLGHSAVGYIADQKLSKKARGFVTEILGVELLAVAATWPDAVRSDVRYSGFAPFHFLEIGPGFTFDTLPSDRRALRDADTIIAQAPDQLLDPKVSRDRKIILLKYLVHIVGDVHQPLHIGNGLDMGANLCDVKIQDSKTRVTSVTNLHSAWDDRIMDVIRESFFKNQEPGQKKSYFGFKELSEMLLKDAPLAELEKSASDPKSVWYDESQKLHSSVYPDATPYENPMDRPYCKLVDAVTKKVVDGKYDATKIPTLSEEYLLKSADIIKRRILQAGFRLAHLLNETAKKSRAAELSSDADAKILESALLTNGKSQRGPNSPTKAKRSKKISSPREQVSP